MAYTDKQKQRDAWNRWYHRNKAKKQSWAKGQRDKSREWLRSLKATLTCSRCPESHPACIQFHHLDPAEKDLELGNAVRFGWSIERIEAEIAKCIVLCGNCHAKEHYERKHNSSV